MKKVEKRDITVRRVKLADVLIEEITDVELSDIIANVEEDLEEISVKRNLLSTTDLFAYLALNYAMRLYKIEHLEKSLQKAEEKRLDETIKKVENFLKN